VGGQGGADLRPPVLQPAALHAACTNKQPSVLNAQAADMQSCQQQLP
jgi:hypothetical protein